MKITEKEKIEVALVSNIICNKCGRDCYHQSDYSTLAASWGYHSKKDLQNHEAHLCEECYDTTIKDFKFPPTITERGTFE